MAFSHECLEPLRGSQLGDDGYGIMSQWVDRVSIRLGCDILARRTESTGYRTRWKAWYISQSGCYADVTKRLPKDKIQHFSRDRDIRFSEKSLLSVSVFLRSIGVYSWEISEPLPRKSHCPMHDECLCQSQLRHLLFFSACERSLVPQEYGNRPLVFLTTSHIDIKNKTIAAQESVYLSPTIKPKTGCEFPLLRDWKGNKRFTTS